MSKINKRKILFLLHLPPPVHGSAVVGDFIKNSKLVNSTFDTFYIDLGTSNSIEKIGKSSIGKIFKYFKILISIVIRLIYSKPDLIYLAMTAKGLAFYKDFFVVILAKIFSVKLVIHFHNKGVSERSKNFIDNILYQITFKNTLVILLSKHLYFDIKKYVKKDDVFYCPNGIKDIEIKKEKISNKSKIVKILFLSNLIKSKGVFVLLKALSILKTKSSSFKCNFVGGVGDISEKGFRNKVNNLNLQNFVQYLGMKNGSKKLELFEKSDVFVHPTLNDCFPLVLIEASQFSLPLISTSEGGIPEIINDGVNGFLVPKNDEEKLAEKLLLLIDNKNLRIKLGNEAYKLYLSNYTLRIFEKKICQILNSINLS